MTEEAFEQVAKTYKNCVKEGPLERILQALLSIFGITFDEDLIKLGDKILYFKDLDLPTFKVYPTEINSFDLECIEDVLNNERYSEVVGSTAPMFDVIGWVLSNKSGKWKIHYMQSSTSDIWKDNIKYDLFSEDSEKESWRDGQWEDGWSLEDLRHPKWIQENE